MNKLILYTTDDGKTRLNLRADVQTFSRQHNIQLTVNSPDLLAVIKREGKPHL